MASILSWAKKTAKNVENHAQAVVAQVNPLDNGRTYNTVRQQGAAYAPKAPASVVQQATHNGATNVVGSSLVKPLVNTARMPFDVTRLAEANILRNKTLADQARIDLGKSANGSIFGAVKPLGADLANVAYQKSGALDRQANRQAQNEQNLIHQVAGNSPKANMYADLYANAEKQGVYGQALASGGINLNDSNGTLLRKTGGKIAAAASPTMYALAPEALAGKTALGTAAKVGTLNAANSVANVAQTDATLPEYLKQGAVGFAAGAALPLALSPAARGLALKGGKLAATKTTDIAIAKPYRNISDQELQAVKRVAQRNAGFGDDIANVQPNDTAIYRNVQRKLGADTNDHGAIDQLIAARQNHATQMQQRAATVQNIGNRLKVSNEIGAVGKNVKDTAADVPKSLRPTIPKLEQTPSMPKLRAGTSLGKSTPKTGIQDKQLNDLHTVRKQILAAEKEDIKNNPIHNPPVNEVSKLVNQRGGISSSAYEDIPKGIIRKSGVSADKMAQELGYNSEDEFINALHTEQAAKAQKLSPSQIHDLAVQNLESGKSQYATDHADVMKQIAQRQDELSRYPTGARKQVKVLTNPTPMHDAELQSLASTPEGMAKKVGNKVVEPTKTTLRNPDAERKVQDVLRKGGTTDEALNEYRRHTGSDLQTAVRDVARVARESNIGFNGGKNPLLGSIKLPIVQAGDHDQAFLNADFVKQHEQAVGQQALDAFHGLSEKDKTLLKSIETDTVSNVAKKADNPQAFANAEKAIRTYYDTRHAYDNALGIDVGYRANYLRQIFAKAEEEAKANLPDQMNIKNGNKNPGYKQHRTNDTLNTHVGDALERDIMGSSSNHAKLAYSEGLHQAYPEQINASGQLVRGDTGPYRQITNRYGQAVTAAPEVAAKINHRTRIETQSKGLQRYDSANAGLKYVKLGGGAFHALTEAGNFIGQQIMSGKILTDLPASGKVLKTFFSPKTMDKAMTEFRTNGTMDKAALSGLKIMAKDILADANVTLGGKFSKYTGIQALHDATFQREIPYAKLKLFEQKTKGLDVSKPADLAKMRSVAAGVNDLFGGINRDISGSIPPNTFKAMQRFVLATDFTESKVRTALRAVNITDKSPAARIARQAVLGKVLLFGAVATAGGALGGEFKNKSPKEVALDIAAKLADPSFHAGRYKVALPATHVSEFSRPITPLVHPASKGSAKGDRFAGLQHYATGRLAAVPSELYQLRTNKDYSGNKIYGKDYAFNGGEQISKGKTALNIASGFTPIPASQGIGVAQGKTDPRAAIANTIGLRVTNEDQYNQDATPVKVKMGDASITLTKQKAIAYNKAVSDQKATLDKQLQATAAYKNANPDAQAAMSKKLHGYITDNQKRIAASQNNLAITKQASSSVQAVNANKLPSNLAKGSSSKAPVALTGDKRGSEFLNNYNALSSDRKKSWSAGPLDPKYKDVYDTSSKIKPAGMPDLPKKNTTLKAYADYLKANQSAANELERNKARGEFLKTAYKADISKPAQDLFGTGYTTASKIDAIKSGDISKTDLENAIGLDNLFVKNGLTSKPSISKSVRAEFGYSTPSTGSGRRTTGRRKGSGRRVSSRKGIPTSVSAIKTPRINTKAKGFKSVSVKAPTFKTSHKSLPKQTAYKTPKVTKVA